MRVSPVQIWASAPFIGTRWRLRMATSETLEVLGPVEGRARELVTPDAFEFAARLHREFNGRREELLGRRQERQARIEAGEMPSFLEETRHVREDSSWRVSPVPQDLQDRRCEITGPVERKMMINALNSGARVFMADFEDANSPTWANVIEGQVNLVEAIERT